MSKKASTTTTDKPTAVVWAWRDDKGIWQPFDSKVITALEADYQKGTKKIKVDKERFVDVSLSFKDICTNFNFKLTKDDNVIGLQRRYDDESKRRAVQRTVPELFDGENVLLLIKEKSDKDELTVDIELYGGLVSSKITKKTTMALCDDEDELNNSFASQAKEATDAKIPIYTKDFITACVKESQLLAGSAAKKYVAQYKPPAPAPAPAPTTAAPVKRKADEDSSQDNKKAKNTTTTTTTTTTSNNNTSSPMDIVSDAPTIKSNTQWMGTCTSEADGSTFPIVMVVKERNGSAFNGEIQWPTLNSAKTKFRGTIKGDDITFEEYEAISGADDVELPMKYSGKVNGNTMTGKNEHDDPEVISAFKIDKLVTPAAKEFESLKEKTKFSGVVYQPFPFIFEVLKRTGAQIEAQITWPELGNAKTKVKGTLEGSDITFQEYETQSDDVVVPVDYTGKVDSSSGKLKIGGAFKGAQSSAGTFELDLSKPAV